MDRLEAFEMWVYRKFFENVMSTEDNKFRGNEKDTRERMHECRWISLET